MEYTTNLNLKKPDVNEYYNIEQENENKDLIDSAIGELNSQVGAETLTTTAQDCTGAINELNKNKAPTNHASTATTYGKATSENYGHVKLSGSVSNTSGKDDGVAATPSAVKNAYDRGTTAINNAKAISDRLVNISNVITNEQLTFSLPTSTGAPTSKDVFVAPASGIYFIDAYAIFAHDTNGNRFFSLGNVDLDGMTCAPASGNSTAIKLNTVVYMSKGQQFFVNLRQSSGTNLNVTIKSRYSYLPL